MVDDAIRRVEGALTGIMRRAHKVHLTTDDGGDRRLDRSAYSVLGRLLDTGPQRLTTLADTFGLDISTVSRQAQSLEVAGLVARERDPDDGRAQLLRLTPAGEAAMRRTRARRRAVLRDLLDTWRDDEVVAFAGMLERFDAHMRDHMSQFGQTRRVERDTANTGDGRTPEGKEG